MMVAAEAVPLDLAQEMTPVLKIAIALAVNARGTDAAASFVMV
jgi:hypothetical protein